MRENPQATPADVIRQLRTLSHDLSNSLESILHAAYLLGKADLDAEEKQWVKVIDSASEKAVRINHQLPEILRAHSQTQPPPDGD